MNRRNDFRKDRGHSKRPSSRRPRPPLRDKLRQFDMIDTSSTGCESQYLSSLIDTCNPIVAVLQQGERIAGQLVWYDQGCLKISPADGSPSLIIPKTSIKYPTMQSFHKLIHWMNLKNGRQHSAEIVLHPSEHHGHGMRGLKKQALSGG
jgi:hypothetical protein